MKIICSDNWGREEVSDHLIAENVPVFYAEPITEFLNKRYGGNDSPDYFHFAPDDHELYVFKP